MQDFRVKTFLTVCRTLNYTRAAEELALTQPAVSQHITYLEREYGAKLFTYHRKKLELTPAGRVLRDGLATMAHDDLLLHERIGEVAHGATVKLRIGMTLTAGEYVVARPLARCLGARPDIQVTVRSGGTQHLMELLDAGTIDCAFVEGLFDKARYASRPFSCRAAGAHLRGRASLPAYAAHPGRPLGRTAHSARGGQRQPQRAHPRPCPAQPLACLFRRPLRRGKPRHHQDIRGGRSWVSPSSTKLPCSGRCRRERCALSRFPMRASSTTSVSCTCATALYEQDMEDLFEALKV